MKLLNCHIYNFGKYHEKKFNLNNDLHEIFLPNGEGKTTLVSFIVAIFFGGEVENIKSLLEKYESIEYPHDRYGGEINFVYNNEEYNLIHTFSKKNNKGKFKSEILKLTKKGSSFVEKRFDDDSPITYFFKDIEKPTSAILNTVILSHEPFSKNNIENSLDDLFSSQLGELYDLKEYDDVAKSIDEKIKEYGSKKAKNTVYARASAQQKETSEQLDLKKKEIKEKKEELKRLFGVDSLRQIGGYVANCNKEIENIEKEIELLKADTSKIDLYQEYKQTYQLLEEKEKALENLNKTINNQPISNDVIVRLDNLNEEIKDEKNKLNKLENEHNSISIDEKYLTISEGEVNNIKRVYEEYQLGKDKLTNDKTDISISTTKYNKAHTYIFMLLTAIFLVNVVIGSCLLYFSNEGSYYLYIYLGVGVGGFLVSLIGSFLYYSKINKQKQIAVNNSLEQNENSEIFKKKKVLEDFFGKLGLSTTDIKYSYDTFLKAYETNIALNNKKKELQTQIINLHDSLDKKESSLINDLSKFGYDKNQSLDTFLFQLKTTKKTIIEFNNEIHSIKNELADSRYKDFDKLDKNQLNYQSKQQSIDDLNKKRNELIGNRRELIDKTNSYNKAIEEQRILNDKYNEFINEVRYYEDLAKLYTKGKKFLDEAKESIYASTYEPFLNELNKILDTEKENEKFFNSYEIKTDKNKSQIIFKNKGVEKTSASLSKGYQDYLKLAVRFSFLNMIYKKEKPFIILDDPLVNMDKDRLNNIKDIIKTLSKKYQIIYFYCHDSRKIN